jgi:hypothetical protein
MATCVRCGLEKPGSELLRSGIGAICRTCEAEAEDEERDLSEGWAALLAPPGLFAASVVALCVPFVGPIIATLVAGTAIASGGVAASRGWARRGSGDPKDQALLVSATVGLVGGTVSLVTALACGGGTLLSLYA